MAPGTLLARGRCAWRVQELQDANYANLKRIQPHGVKPAPIRFEISLFV